MRLAAKIDANHVEIVKAVRQAGCTVQSLAAVGKGCPDLMVGTNNITALFEVKDGEKSASRRALNEHQVAWHRAWCGGPVFVVDSVDSALQAVTLMRKMKVEIRQ